MAPQRKLAVAALLVALVGAVLSGCSDPPPSIESGQRPFTAVARFLPGDEVTMIEVTVNDRQPLRSAELVGPDGKVIPAESLDVNQAISNQAPFIRPPITGGLASGSGGMALPLGGFGNVAPPGSETVSAGQIRSTAQLRIDEPLTYRRDWRLWQIRLRIGDAPHVNVLSLAAPRPPAAL
jgi:hypothetical protein